MTLVGSESNKPGAPVAEGKENLEVKKEAEDKSASVKKAEERPKASKKNSASGDAIKSGRTSSKALLLCLADGKLYDTDIIACVPQPSPYTSDED